MRGRLLVAGVLLEIGILGACGARTSLSLPTTDDTGAGQDAGVDRDAPAIPDAPEERIEDVSDVVEEGLPSCDPDALYIYLVTSETVLYRFYPPTNEFKVQGAIVCPADFPGATPFSMGVDRKARGYVVYNDGELFIIDVETAECDGTPFLEGQNDFFTFGMGFAIDDDMMGESLYVAEISFMDMLPSLGLATIDTTTFDLQFIGEFVPPLVGDGMELTSSDDGKLYGFNLDPAGGGWLRQIDKSSGAIVESTFLPIGDGSSSLAFAYWGGDFYVFTGEDGLGTTVTRYRPSDGSVTVIQNLAEQVVGAGVSTCDPKR